MVRGSNPGGARFFARPDRPWAPPSLLYNGYRVFPGGKVGWSVTLTTHPLLVPWSWKSRAIPLPTVWATTGPVTGTLYLYLLLLKVTRSIYLHDTRCVAVVAVTLCSSCSSEAPLIIPNSLRSADFQLMGSVETSSVYFGIAIVL